MSEPSEPTASEILREASRELDTIPPPPRKANVKDPNRKQRRASTNPAPVPDMPTVKPPWVAEILETNRAHHDESMAMVREIVRAQNISALKIESELANFTLLAKAFTGFRSEVQQAHHNIRLEQDTQRHKVGEVDTRVDRLQRELDAVRQEIVELKRCPEVKRLTVLENIMREHLDNHTDDPPGTVREP